MRTVRVFDSLRYGGTLLAYLVAVVLVGGGVVAGGVALALPGRVGLDPVAVGTGRLVGGLLLGAVGTGVLAAGLFGVVHKLVADSVSAGVELGTPEPDPPDVTVAPGDRSGMEVSATEASEPGDSSPDESAEKQDGKRDTRTAERSDSAHGNEEPRQDPGDEEARSEPGSAETPSKPGSEEMRPEDDESLEEWIERTAGEPGADDREVQPAETDRDEADGTLADAETTVTGTGDEGPPDDGSESESRDQREPSPEEIAFGTEDDESVPEDPLAEPTDE